MGMKRRTQDEAAFRLQMTQKLLTSALNRVLTDDDWVVHLTHEEKPVLRSWIKNTLDEIRRRNFISRILNG